MGVFSISSKLSICGADKCRVGQLWNRKEKSVSKGAKRRESGTAMIILEGASSRREAMNSGV